MFISSVLRWVLLLLLGSLKKLLQGMAVDGLNGGKCKDWRFKFVTSDISVFNAICAFQVVSVLLYHNLVF